MYSHMAVRGRDFVAVLKSISFSPIKYMFACKNIINIAHTQYQSDLRSNPQVCINPMYSVCI